MELNVAKADLRELRGHSSLGSVAKSASDRLSRSSETVVSMACQQCEQWLQDLVHQCKTSGDTDGCSPDELLVTPARTLVLPGMLILLRTLSPYVTHPLPALPASLLSQWRSLCSSPSIYSARVSKK